jgi:hypothetical protein
MLLTFFGIIALATACQSPQPRSVRAGGNATRNNAASLLYDLLGDEKNVSKLLIIKRDRRELHEVIKNVASTSDAARKSLEKLAREDATLDLKTMALPPGEKAARASESKARASELLHASGAALEFKLLLTQAEALAYATHLAKVAAENESSPTRAKAFAEISGQMNARLQDVLNLLRSPPR